MPLLFNVDAELHRQRRENVRDSEMRLVIIGNGITGNPYADDNHLWVRDIGGKGSSDYNTPGLPYRVLAGVGPTPEIDKQVWVQWRSGPRQYQVVMSDPDHMAQTGRSMHLENPTDPHNQFHRTESLLPLLSLPVGGMKVNVQGWQYVTADGEYIDYKGTSNTAGTHVDFTSSRPGTADHHCYGLLVFNVDEFLASNNPIQVYVSTSQAVTTALDKTDIQECIDQMPANCVPIKAYRLYNGQTEVRGHASDRDLRGWPVVPTRETIVTSDDASVDITYDAPTNTYDLSVTSGGGAPTDATYLVQVADTDLPNAQAMGALGTGLVKNTTGTGVQSIATAGTDYTTPTGTENLSNKTITASSLVASALSLLIGGFKAIFSHANTADRTYTLPDYDGTLATLSGTETLSGKTLTTPTIASFVNANHNHSNSAGGGNLTGAAFGTQSPNTFLAGHQALTTTPTFRAMVSDDIPANAITTTKINNNAVTTAKLQLSAVTQNELANDAVVTAKILNQAVTLAKMANGTSGSLIGYDPSTGAVSEILRSSLAQVTVDFQRFVTPGTFTGAFGYVKPSGAFAALVICIAGGSGGGSGRRGATSTVRFGGGGGASGNVTQMLFAAGQLASSETVVVGAGGTGGAAQTTNDTNGNTGNTGDPSYFGGGSETAAKLVAINAANGGGVGGTNATGAGGTGNVAFGPTVQFYGANGGTSSVTLSQAQGKSAGYGPASGGAGAYITSANALGNPGDGGTATGAIFRSTRDGGGGAAGSSSAGGNGANGSSTLASNLFGDGGGGGKQSGPVGAGQPGGTGGTPGGGGGGGSGSINGTNSGAGGDGGPGGVIVITWCYA